MKRFTFLPWAQHNIVSNVLLFIVWVTAVHLILHHHLWGLSGIGLLFLLLGRIPQAWSSPSDRIKPIDLASRRTVHCLAVALPILLLWILYYKVVGAWWMHDDPRILRMAVEHGLFRPFYQPTILRTLTTSLLMPWLPFSLGVDFYVWGLNSFGFYLHHLVSFSLAVLSGYSVLCLFSPPIIVSFILSIFVASVPSATVVQLLMTRHYIEGLVFCCAAVLLYVKSLRENKFFWSCLGSVLYFLAASAKEIYVPVVAILPFLPVSERQHRWKMLPPFIIMSVGYVLWRAYMLGPQHFLSGYGEIYRKPDWKDMIRLPGRAAEIVGWVAPWQWGISAFIMLLYLSGLWRKSSIHRWVFFPLLGIMSIITLIPVIPILSPRYLFIPVFIVSIALGAGLNVVERLRVSSTSRSIIMLCLGLCVLLSNLKAVEQSPLWKDRKMVEAYRTVGRFVLFGKDKNTLLMTSIGSAMYYHSLAWLREHVLQLDSGPKVCYDLCVCSRSNIQQTYQYTNGSLKKINVAAVRRQTDCGKEMADLRVSLVFDPEENTMSWEFGPYNEGQYYYAGPSGNYEVSGHFRPMLSEGTIPYALSTPLSFVIKYISSEGWRTYSPILTIDPKQIGDQGKAELHWRRMAIRAKNKQTPMRRY